MVPVRPSCATVASPARPGQPVLVARIMRSYSRRAPRNAQTRRAAATVQVQPCRSAKAAHPATPTVRFAPPRASPAIRSNLPAAGGLVGVAGEQAQGFECRARQIDRRARRRRPGREEVESVIGLEARLPNARQSALDLLDRIEQGIAPPKVSQFFTVDHGWVFTSARTYAYF